MSEHPILFSAPMVRAILDGRKAMARQIIRLPTKSLSGAPIYEHPKMGGWEATTAGGGGCFTFEKDGTRKPVPEMVAIWHRTCGVTIATRHQPGDRLWVRETWASVPASAYRCSEGVAQTVNPSDWTEAAIYRAGFDRSRGGIRWRSPIHMPRWASRITLAVEAVRVERLQDISDEDCFAEGIDPETDETYLSADHARLGGVPLPWGTEERCAYAAMWNSINGRGALDANPWVSVTTFRRVEA